MRWNLKDPLEFVCALGTIPALTEPQRAQLQIGYYEVSYTEEQAWTVMVRQSEIQSSLQAFKVTYGPEGYSVTKPWDGSRSVPDEQSFRDKPGRALNYLATCMLS